MQKWFLLLLAIVAETVATSALKASDGFSKLLPSLVVVAGYLTAFFLLSLTLKTIPVGVAYAIWSGVGIVLVSLVAAVLYKQMPDVPTLIGLLLILSGVLVINLFSKTPSH